MKPLAIAAAIAAVAACCGAARAETPGAIDEYQADSLRGMSPIVIVLNYSGRPELASEPGLSEEGLLSAVEVQLRRSGVPTKRRGVGEGAIGGFLHVSVNMGLVEPLALYVIGVEVLVVQSATLTRDKSVEPLVVTWRAASSGASPRSGLTRLVRAGIEDHLNAFLGDYLEQNPRH